MMEAKSMNEYPTVQDALNDQNSNFDDTFTLSPIGNDPEEVFCDFNIKTIEEIEAKYGTVEVSRDSKELGDDTKDLSDFVATDLTHFLRADFKTKLSEDDINELEFSEAILKSLDVTAVKCVSLIGEKCKQFTSIGEKFEELIDGSFVGLNANCGEYSGLSPKFSHVSPGFSCSNSEETDENIPENFPEFVNTGKRIEELIDGDYTGLTSDNYKVSSEFSRISENELVQKRFEKTPYSKHDELSVRKIKGLSGGNFAKKPENFSSPSPELSDLSSKCTETKAIDLSQKSYRNETVGKYEEFTGNRIKVSIENCNVYSSPSPELSSRHLEFSATESKELTQENCRGLTERNYVKFSDEKIKELIEANLEEVTLHKPETFSNLFSKFHDNKYSGPSPKLSSVHLEFSAKESKELTQEDFGELTEKNYNKFCEENIEKLIEGNFVELTIEEESSNLPLSPKFSKGKIGGEGKGNDELNLGKHEELSEGNFEQSYVETLEEFPDSSSGFSELSCNKISLGSENGILKEHKEYIGKKNKGLIEDNFDELTIEKSLLESNQKSTNKPTSTTEDEAFFCLSSDFFGLPPKCVDNNPIYLNQDDFDYQTKTTPEKCFGGKIKEVIEGNFGESTVEELNVFCPGFSTELNRNKSTQSNQEYFEKSTAKEHKQFTDTKIKGLIQGNFQELTFAKREKSSSFCKEFAERNNKKLTTESFKYTLGKCKESSVENIKVLIEENSNGSSKFFENPTAKFIGENFLELAKIKKTHKQINRENIKELIEKNFAELTIEKREESISKGLEDSIKKAANNSKAPSLGSTQKFIEEKPEEFSKFSQEGLEDFIKKEGNFVDNSKSSSLGSTQKFIEESFAQNHNELTEKKIKDLIKGNFPELTIKKCKQFSETPNLSTDESIHENFEEAMATKHNGEETKELIDIDFDKLTTNKFIEQSFAEFPMNKHEESIGKFIRNNFKEKHAKKRNELIVKSFRKLNRDIKESCQRINCKTNPKFTRKNCKNLIQSKLIGKRLTREEHEEFPRKNCKESIQNKSIGKKLTRDEHEEFIRKNCKELIRNKLEEFTGIKSGKLGGIKFEKLTRSELTDTKFIDSPEPKSEEYLEANFEDSSESKFGKLTKSPEKKFEDLLLESKTGEFIDETKFANDASEATESTGTIFEEKCKKNTRGRNKEFIRERSKEFTSERSKELVNGRFRKSIKRECDKSTAERLKLKKSEGKLRKFMEEEQHKLINEKHVELNNNNCDESTDRCKQMTEDLFNENLLEDEDLLSEHFLGDHLFDSEHNFFDLDQTIKEFNTFFTYENFNCKSPNFTKNPIVCDAQSAYKEPDNQSIFEKHDEPDLCKDIEMTEIREKPVSFNDTSLVTGLEPLLNSDIALKVEILKNEEASLNEQMLLNQKIALNKGISPKQEMTLSKRTPLNQQMSIKHEMALNKEMALNEEMPLKEETLYNVNQQRLNEENLLNEHICNQKMPLNRNILMNHDEETTTNENLNRNMIFSQEICLNQGISLNDGVLLNNELSVNGEMLLNNDVSPSEDIELNEEMRANKDMPQKRGMSPSVEILNQGMSPKQVMLFSQKMHLGKKSLLNQDEQKLNKINSLHKTKVVRNKIHLNESKSITEEKYTTEENSAIEENVFSEKNTMSEENTLSEKCVMDEENSMSEKSLIFGETSTIATSLSINNNKKSYLLNEKTVFRNKETLHLTLEDDSILNKDIFLSAQSAIASNGNVTNGKENALDFFNGQVEDANLNIEISLESDNTFLESNTNIERDHVTFLESNDSFLESNKLLECNGNYLEAADGVLKCNEAVLGSNDEFFKPLEIEGNYFEMWQKLKRDEIMKVEEDNFKKDEDFNLKNLREEDNFKIDESLKRTKILEKHENLMVDENINMEYLREDNFKIDEDLKRTKILKKCENLMVDENINLEYSREEDNFKIDDGLKRTNILKKCENLIVDENINLENFREDNFKIDENISLENFKKQEDLKIVENIKKLENLMTDENMKHENLRKEFNFKDDEDLKMLENVKKLENINLENLREEANIKKDDLKRIQNLKKCENFMKDANINLENLRKESNFTNCESKVKPMQNFLNTNNNIINFDTLICSNKSLDDGQEISKHITSENSAKGSFLKPVIDLMDIYNKEENMKLESLRKKGNVKKVDLKRIQNLNNGESSVKDENINVENLREDNSKTDKDLKRANILMNLENLLKDENMKLESLREENNCDEDHSKKIKNLRKQNYFKKDENSKIKEDLKTDECMKQENLRAEDNIKKAEDLKRLENLKKYNQINLNDNENFSKCELLKEDKNSKRIKISRKEEYNIKDAALKEIGSKNLNFNLGHEDLNKECNFKELEVLNKTENFKIGQNLKKYNNFNKYKILNKDENFKTGKKFKCGNLKKYDNFNKYKILNKDEDLKIGQSLKKYENVQIGKNIKKYENLKIGQNFNMVQNLKKCENLEIGQNLKIGQNVKIEQNFKKCENLEIEQNVKKCENLKMGQIVKKCENLKAYDFKKYKSFHRNKLKIEQKLEENESFPKTTADNLDQIKISGEIDNSSQKHQHFLDIDSFWTHDENLLRDDKDFSTEIKTLFDSVPKISIPENPVELEERLTKNAKEIFKHMITENQPSIFDKIEQQTDDISEIETILMEEGIKILSGDEDEEFNNLSCERKVFLNTNNKLSNFDTLICSNKSLDDEQEIGKHIASVKSNFLKPVIDLMDIECSFMDVEAEENVEECTEKMLNTDNIENTEDALNTEHILTIASPKESENADLLNCLQDLEKSLLSEYELNLNKKYGSEHTRNPIGLKLGAQDVYVKEGYSGINQTDNPTEDILNDLEGISMSLDSKTFKAEHESLNEKNSIYNALDEIFNLDNESNVGLKTIPKALEQANEAINKNVETKAEISNPTEKKAMKIHSNEIETFDLENDIFGFDLDTDILGNIEYKRNADDNEIEKNCIDNEIEKCNINTIPKSKIENQNSEHAEENTIKILAKTTTDLNLSKSGEKLNADIPNVQINPVKRKLNLLYADQEKADEKRMRSETNSSLETKNFENPAKEIIINAENKAKRIILQMRNVLSSGIGSKIHTNLKENDLIESLKRKRTILQGSKANFDAATSLKSKQLNENKLENVKNSEQRNISNTQEHENRKRAKVEKSNRKSRVNKENFVMNSNKDNILSSDDEGDAFLTKDNIIITKDGKIVEKVISESYPNDNVKQKLGIESKTQKNSDSSRNKDKDDPIQNNDKNSNKNTIESPLSNNQIKNKSNISLTHKKTSLIQSNNISQTQRLSNNLGNNFVLIPNNFILQQKAIECPGKIYEAKDEISVTKSINKQMNKGLICKTAQNLCVTQNSSSIDDKQSWFQTKERKHILNPIHAEAKLDKENGDQLHYNISKQTQMQLLLQKVIPCSQNIIVMKDKIIILRNNSTVASQKIDGQKLTLAQSNHNNNIGRIKDNLLLKNKAVIMENNIVSTPVEANSETYSREIWIKPSSHHDNGSPQDTNRANSILREATSSLSEDPSSNSIESFTRDIILDDASLSNTETIESTIDTEISAVSCNETSTNPIEKFLRLSKEDLELDETNFGFDKENLYFNKENLHFNKENLQFDKETLQFDKENSQFIKEILEVNEANPEIEIHKGNLKIKNIQEDTKEMSRKDKEMASKNVEMSVINKEMSRKDKEVALKNKEVSVMSKEMSRKNKEMTVKNKGMPVINKEMLVANKEILVNSKDSFQTITENQIKKEIEQISKPMMVSKVNENFSKKYQNQIDLEKLQISKENVFPNLTSNKKITYQLVLYAKKLPVIRQQESLLQKSKEEKAEHPKKCSESFKNPETDLKTFGNLSRLGKETSPENDNLEKLICVQAEQLNQSDKVNKLENFNQVESREKLNKHEKVKLMPFENTNSNESNYQEIHESMFAGKIIPLSPDQLDLNLLKKSGELSYEKLNDPGNAMLSQVPKPKARKFLGKSSPKKSNQILLENVEKLIYPKKAVFAEVPILSENLKPLNSKANAGIKNLTSGLQKKKHRPKDTPMCYICQKCFSKESQLQKHVKSHCEEIPFACDICHMGFSKESFLKNHRRHHFKAPKAKS